MVNTDRLRSDGFWPWVFIAPAAVIASVFYLWPIVQSVAMSFQSFGAFGGGEFVGIRNYVDLVTDGRFLRALLNTTVFTLIVLCSIPLALFFASLMSRPGLRFVTLFRVLFFLPYLAMPVAISFVFRLLFNGDFGLVNYGLGLIGIDGPYWLSTEWFALVAVGIMSMWTAMGFNVLILSAGLQAIPAEFYEAASLDGASKIRQFRAITIPLVGPSLFLVLIMTVINSFQMFDQLFALLGTNNPVIGDTQSLVYLFYEQAFILNDRGYASSIALAIMLLIGALTLVQFSARRRFDQ